MFEKMGTIAKKDVGNFLLKIFLWLFVLSLNAFASEPLHVRGDSASWNHQTQDLWIKGHVSILQSVNDGKQRRLTCDMLHYNKVTDKITAYGGVELTEPDGDVLTADHLELDSDLNTGLLEGMRVFTKDAARLSAKSATRIEGMKTIFLDADYSPCKECAEGPVTWKLEAKSVEHNQEEKLIKYKHVYLVFKGVKIFYMPYFSHPDPSVKQKNGLLAPSIGMSKALGFSMSLPYLFAAKDQDLTITPILMAKQNPLLAAEYRKRFRDGEMTFGGSHTRMRHNRKLYTQIPRKDRWNISSSLYWHMTDRNRLIMDLNRASDTTYLSKYRLNKQSSTFSGQKNLVSTVNYEHFGDSGYGTIRGQAFQTDTPLTTPVVLPDARYRLQTSQFSNGSYVVWDSNFVSIFRRRPVLDETGKQTFRASSGASWHLPYTTSNGHIFKTVLSTRGDAYMSQRYNPDQPTIAAQKKYDNHVEGRVFPQASVDWRYPLLSTYDRVNWVLEPRGLIALAPNKLNRKRLPNEDSRMFTLDDTAIFLPNRFDGIDLVDEGQRGVLGVDNHMRWGRQQRASFFMGQSYRFDHKDIVGKNQGEGRLASDYISRVLYQPNEWWVIFVRGSFLRKNMRSRFTECGASFGKPILKLDTSYVHARRGLNGAGAMISQMNWQVSSELNENWKVSVAQIRNLKHFQRGVLASFVGLTYQDDCFESKFSVYRSNYRDRDLKPDMGFFLQFSLKNLGSFTPSSAPTYPGSILTNLR